VGVIGLPGIGRRAFIKHTSRSLLNIRRQVTVRIQDGDSISDVALKVADQIEPYTSNAGLEIIDKEIKKASDNDNVYRILADLRLSVANGELPVFLDEGGLLNEEGKIEEPIQRILAGLSTNDEAYVFFVSSRRPNQPESNPLPIIQLKPLKEEEIKILIASIANASNLRLKANEISELAGYTGGFPPACYYAIQLAKDYGLAAVMADKYKLVEFRTSTFVKFISEKKLTHEQTKVLLILAEYSPLPLPVIGKSLGHEPKVMSDLLTRLVDYSLVYPDEHGFYRISDPIRDAIVRMHRMMSKTQHSAVSQALQAYLDTEADDRPRLELSRVLFKAATQSNNTILADQVIHLANDVIQLAEQSYHGRDYATAVTLGREAVALRPKSFNARSYLIRALIHEELWGEATEELNKLNGIAPPRDIYYLQGFLERKRRNVDNAIHLFEMAEKAGRSGVAIKRELASCYFIKGDYKKALDQINAIVKDSGDNAFVVDLWVQVATKMGDEDAAREALARLEAIDPSGFYHHRASTVEARFGDVAKSGASQFLSR
jgi:Tfp pilus assembly protein PilF